MSGGKNETLPITSSTTAVVIKTCLCLLLLLIGLLGNGMIVFLVLRFKALRTIPNILLTNLATVDFLNVIINAPLMLLYQVYDIKALNTKTAGWWTAFSLILFLQLNFISMFLLVLDRYLALVYPIKYTLSSRKTCKNTLYAICLGWLLALFITGCITVREYDIDLGRVSVLHYHTAYTKNRSSKYFTFPTILATLIPSIVLSLLTIRKVRRNKITATTMSGIQTLRKNGDEPESFNTKSACTILMVLLAYAVCCLCGVILFTIALTFSQIQNWLYFFGRFVFFCGSCCNSFMYVMRSSKLKKALQETFKLNNRFKNRINYSRQKIGIAFYIKGPFGKQRVCISKSALEGHCTSSRAC